MKKRCILLGMVATLVYAGGCSNWWNPVPGDNTDTDGVDSVVQQCGQDGYLSSISGDADSGKYYWLGLVDADTLVKAGDSVYLSGQYQNVPLSLTVDYSDNIPAGDYLLKVFASGQASDVGIVAKRLVAQDVQVVTVRSYSLQEMIDECGVEVLYKTFIACPVIPKPGGFLTWWVHDYYSGDSRCFNSLITSSSRSIQMCSVLVVNDFPGGEPPGTNMWFGSSTGWDSYQILPNDSTICSASCEGIVAPAQYDSAKCQDWAMPGQDGNVLSMIFTSAGDSVYLDIDLEGGNPCWNAWFGPPQIDGHFRLWLRGDFVTGTREYRLEGYHDGYPWHEIYLDGLEILRHNPSDSGDSPLSLFPGVGDYTVSTDWTLF